MTTARSTRFAWCTVAVAAGAVGGAQGKGFSDDARVRSFDAAESSWFSASTTSLSAFDHEAARVRPSCLESGYRASLHASGLNVPLQMAIDDSGRLFAGSGAYTREGVKSRQPEFTPFIRVDVSGKVHALGERVEDPDALTLGPDGRIYTGAFGGRVMVHEIDEQGRVRSQVFAADRRLGNIDGMAWFQGDLYTVAFDHARVYRIHGSTGWIEPFADLTDIGFHKLTGIAFDPWEPFCYISAPEDGRIARLDRRDGRVLDASFSIGLQFVGHLAFDRSGVFGADLFAADNGAGCVWRIDRTTGARRPFVVGLLPRTGGLVFGRRGTLYVSRLTDDGQVGEVWAVQGAKGSELDRASLADLAPARQSQARSVQASDRPDLAVSAPTSSGVVRQRGVDGPMLIAAAPVLVLRRRRVLPEGERMDGLLVDWDDLVFLAPAIDQTTNRERSWEGIGTGR